MASYVELDGLRRDAGLTSQVIIALVVAGEAIKDKWVVDPATLAAGELKWARYVTNKPEAEVHKALNLMLADYKSATVGQITSATDATVQAKVDALVPVLVAASVS
jgi:hypothetical protein